MKKRTMKERKEAFKKAYYDELKKQGLVDTQEEVITEVAGVGLEDIVKLAEEDGLITTEQVTEQVEEKKPTKKTTKKKKEVEE